MSPKRRLVYRFLDLPHVRRVEVARQLGIAPEDDPHFSREESYAVMLRTAEERSLIGKL